MIRSTRSPATDRLLWALPALVVLLVLAACGTAVETQVTRGVNGYCATVSPAERAIIRARVNLAIAPHQVMVYCSGDEEAAK